MDYDTRVSFGAAQRGPRGAQELERRNAPRSSRRRVTALPATPLHLTLDACWAGVLMVEHRAEIEAVEPALEGSEISTRNQS
jgi:hypothetical protein